MVSCSRGLWVLVVAVASLNAMAFEDVQQINSASVILGDLRRPNATAVPESCVTLTATAESLAPSPSPKWTTSQSIELCVEENGNETMPYAFHFEVCIAQLRSRGSPSAAIRLEAVQSGPAPGSLLVWSSLILLPGGRAVVIDIDMGEAVLTQKPPLAPVLPPPLLQYGQPAGIQPFSLPNLDSNSTTCSSIFIENLENHTSQNQPEQNNVLHLVLSATAGAAAAGILSLSFFRKGAQKDNDDLLESDTHLRTMISTVDASCSPMLAWPSYSSAANNNNGAGGRGRWTRDPRGRLLRGEAVMTVPPPANSPSSPVSKSSSEEEEENGLEE